VNRLRLRLASVDTTPVWSTNFFLIGGAYCSPPSSLPGTTPVWHTLRIEKQP
jgi:hypothetical protein